MADKKNCESKELKDTELDKVAGGKIPGTSLKKPVAQLTKEKAPGSKMAFVPEGPITKSEK